VTFNLPFFAGGEVVGLGQRITSPICSLDTTEEKHTIKYII